MVGFGRIAWILEQQNIYSGFVGFVELVEKLVFMQGVWLMEGLNEIFVFGSKREDCWIIKMNWKW